MMTGPARLVAVLRRGTSPGYPGYQVVIAASPESTTVLAGFLDSGGHPPLHTHDVDLFFVVLDGSTTIRLGHDSHPAKAGEVIYIPAGSRTEVTTRAAQPSAISRS